MSKLRDHVWIWGHPPGKLNEPCNLDSQMTPMESALYLGARNVFYIPMGKKMNMTQCNKAMDTLNHVGWAIEKAYKRPEVIDRLLEQAEMFPNINNGILDDFLNEENPGNNHLNYSPELLGEIRHKLHTGASHKVELWQVLYTKQLERSELPTYVPCFDLITLWFWNESELPFFEQRCERFFEKTPGSRRMVGIYLYGFGDEAPTDPNMVRHELDTCRRYLKEGKIEGFILHSNAVADMDFEAVAVAKAWMAEHGDEEI